ncbi:MAG: hypothetical protein ACFCD0_22980 [Gemmataceae bacterium]
MLRIMLGSLVFSLAGCVANFDHAKARYQLENSSLQIADENNESIESIRALRPQLTFPCKLAVYLHPSEYNQWEWTSEDKKILEAWGMELQRKNVVQNAFLLPGMLLGEKKDLRSLRVAAAKCGADALLVVQGGTATDDYMNPAAALNLTVVGGFVIPASHCDALFIAQSLLVDVNNGFVYASAEGEGKGSVIRPTFIIESSAAINQAKTQALQNLGPQIAKHMVDLKTRAHTPLTFPRYHPEIK